MPDFLFLNGQVLRVRVKFDWLNPTITTDQTFRLMVCFLVCRNKKAPERRMDTRVLAETESYESKLSKLQ